MIKRRSPSRGAKATKSADGDVDDPIRARGQNETNGADTENETGRIAQSDGDFRDLVEQNGENADTAGSDGQLDAEGEIALMVLATGDVAKRAYELFLARGGMDGYDLEDWLTAERELRQSQQSSRGESQQSRRESQQSSRRESQQSRRESQQSSRQ